MTLSISAIYPAEQFETLLNVPVLRAPVSAGPPAHVEPLRKSKLNLNSFFVKNAKTTFFMRVAGDSMEHQISDGDWLVVDTSLTAGEIAVVEVDGEFTVKRLERGPTLKLVPDNKRHKTVELGEDQSCKVWGIVLYVVKQAV